MVHVNLRVCARACVRACMCASPRGSTCLPTCKMWLSYRKSGRLAPELDHACTWGSSSHSERVCASSHYERCGGGSDTFTVPMIRVSPAVVGSEGQKAINSYGDLVK
jgi:hypothetical protein